MFLRTELSHSSPEGARTLVGDAGGGGGAVEDIIGSHVNADL